MTTNNRIEQLLEMLDNPEAYSEQDIRDFIAHDEEVREVWQTMVEARQSYRRQHADSQPIDVDEAWQRFCENDKFPRFSLHPILNKVAAIIGVLLISGLSYAAFIQIQRRNEARQAQETIVDTPKQAKTITVSSKEKTDTLQVEPKTFDNIPLGDMLPEIAHRYGMTVSFHSEEAKALRLYFTWNPQEPVDKTISKLNQFERLSVKRDGENIIVE